MKNYEGYRDPWHAVTATVRSQFKIPSLIVHDYITDYVNKHARFLPVQYCNYRVEAGGQGAGTVISYTLVMRRGSRDLRMNVSEPLIKQTIVESNQDSSYVVRWRLLAQNLDLTDIMLETEWRSRKRGMRALLEHVFATIALRRMHRQTLINLEQLIRQEVTLSS